MKYFFGSIRIETKMSRKFWMRKIIKKEDYKICEAERDCEWNAPVQVLSLFRPAAFLRVKARGFSVYFSSELRHFRADFPCGCALANDKSSSKFHKIENRLKVRVVKGWKSWNRTSTRETRTTAKENWMWSNRFMRERRAYWAQMLGVVGVVGRYFRVWSCSILLFSILKRKARALP